jgi:hypothetical protein
MNDPQLTKNRVFPSSNVRAEDGSHDPSRWDSLCEGVLIPLGSLFAVFMVMLCIMLITN